MDDAPLSEQSLYYKRVGILDKLKKWDRYNVLMIEWDGDVAYRMAKGWIYREGVGRSLSLPQWEEIAFGQKCRSLAVIQPVMCGGRGQLTAATPPEGWEMRLSAYLRKIGRQALIVPAEIRPIHQSDRWVLWSTRLVLGTKLHHAF